MIEMTSDRIDEIYAELAKVQVKMSTDPRTQGASYILSKITECKEAMEIANAYFQEAHKAFGKAQQNSRLLKLELKREIEAEVMSLGALEDVGFEEKKLIAKSNVLQKVKERKFALLKLKNPLLKIEEVADLENEVVDAESMEYCLRSLIKVLEEKKAEIKQADSAVRLQQKTMEDEKRAIYSPPSSFTAKKRVQKTPEGDDITSDENWSGLAE